MANATPVHMRNPEDDLVEDDLSTNVVAAVQPAAQPTSRFCVRVLEGTDVGHTLEVAGTMPSPARVGTSSGSDLRLTDRQVSRRHLALEVVGDRLRLTDLGSSNGTVAQGLQVTECFVDHGDRIRIGATTLGIERLAPGLATSSPSTSFGRLLGASPRMRRLHPTCVRLAAATIPVLIEGETGTGKEVLAEALHEQGPRSTGPFVVLDCTTLPPNLVEAELFGYERGAFTGAVGTRRGVFEQAEGGTLFIDEIGDLPAPLQPKLLRAIERSEIRRLGSESTIRVDVRILCATRRDLDREVQQQRFRDDLFHRLVVGRVELPPLRDRLSDIPLLVKSFCRELGGSEHAVHAELRKWEAYSWPGNVRELRNKVARFLALGDFAEQPASVREQLVPDEPEADAYASVLALDLPLIQARARVVADFEHRYIAKVLAAHGGNVGKAAAASGIARRHFQRIRSRTDR